MPEPSIVAVANQKGGVGKTTTTVNLAASIAQTGKKVLVIDMDCSGNATEQLGVEFINDMNIYYAAMNDKTLGDIRQKSNIELVDVLASSPLIEELNTALLGHPNQNKFVERILDCDELEEYDVVLIDTHPSLDYVFQAVMTAAQYYIVPIFAEKHSISGLVQMFKKVEEVRKYLNSTLRLLGCVFTRYDVKNSTHVKFEKQIRAVSKTAAFKVFTTMIPNSISVAGASASSQSLLSYKKSSPVTIAYMTLAGEMSPELRGRQRGKPRTVVKTDILQNEIPRDEDEAGIDL